MPTILPYLGLLFQTYKNWLTHVIITLKNGDLHLGSSKTVCLISGNVYFIDETNWFSGTETIQKSDSIEIRGTVFSSRSLSGVPDYFGRNKISSGGDLSHYSSASLY